MALGIVLFVFYACQAGESSRTVSGSWPGFLGAGASPLQPASVPRTWSPDENIAWTAKVPGYGQSSPVIIDKRVFVTSVQGDQKESLHVVCLNLADGRQIWTHQETSGFLEKNSVYISRAAPTPVVDSSGVYAYFESGDVIALTLDGAVRWRKSLSTDYAKPTNEFGLSASPVQTDEHVIILIDDPATAYLVALNKSDGSQAWKTDRTARTSWSSPALVQIDGQAQVVCSSAGSVDGYSAATGELLWTVTDVGGNTATTPLDAGNGRFLIAASPGRQGENSELAKKSNGLMEVKRSRNAWIAEFVWKTPDATPSWASPVIHGGLAYWVNRVGVVYCLDADSGDAVYTHRIKQSAWATPIAVGEHLYVFGKDGVTTVLAGGRDYQVLAENSLWSDDAPPVNNVPTAEEESEERRRGAAMFSRPTLYGVAIVDDSIVMRTGSQVFCVRSQNTAASLSQ
ncbi:MAG: PQQ-binding-like beta-propeller repeat protein [Planctomycetaceae bacterium]|nr:PQQ-binding-like beta-propeller repeat protein [Planctomycetaceae bacterium]